MVEIAFLVLTCCALTAFFRWRLGLVLCVFVGLMLDPLRKMAPGQPAYFVVLGSVVFAAAWISAYMSRVPLSPQAMGGWRRYMGLPFALFLTLVLAQAAHSLIRFGIPLMTAVGLMAWLAPVPAIVLAYQYATRTEMTGLRKWMKFYAALSMTFLAGVYLEYSGLAWRALGEVGVGLTIYDVGTVLKAHSGFFRSSEIAAWHTSTTAAVMFMLFQGKRMTLTRIALAVALIGVLISLGILTGRRKMLIEVMVFLLAYFSLWSWFRKGMARLAIGLAFAGIAGYAAIVILVAPEVLQHRSDTKSYKVDEGNLLQGYAVRGRSGIEDAPARVMELGIAPVSWAMDRYGFLGAGLGTGSQGTQHITGADQIHRGAAEGGLGKVTMELGVPGLLLIPWLIYAFGRYVHQVLMAVTRLSREHAYLAYGFTALLVAKISSFSVATQAFGDLTVLLIMGWCVGFLLALPAMAARAAERGKARKISKSDLALRLAALGRA